MVNHARIFVHNRPDNCADSDGICIFKQLPLTKATLMVGNAAERMTANGYQLIISTAKKHGKLPPRSKCRIYMMCGIIIGKVLCDEALSKPDTLDLAANSICSHNITIPRGLPLVACLRHIYV